MKQNITLSLDKELIQKARLVAVQRDTSVSRLLAEELRQLVEDAERYDRAKRKALDNLQKGFRLGGRRLPSREELHAR